MVVLAKLHPHERDNMIEFDEEPHIYTIKGNESIEITSVTTLVHTLFEKFDTEKILDTIFNRTPIKDKYKDYTRETLKKEWSENGRIQSALGTKLHQDIENYYNGETIENTTKEWSYFKNFHSTITNLKPYRTEWMVFDIDLQLAGSIDMTFENIDGTISIYDWKRSKEIIKTSGFNKWSCHPELSYIPDTNFWHYSFQLNIYKFILEKNYGKKIKDLYLVCLHPNHKNFQLFKCADLSKEVLLIMNERERKIKS